MLPNNYGAVLHCNSNLLLDNSSNNYLLLDNSSNSSNNNLLLHRKEITRKGPSEKLWLPFPPHRQKTKNFASEKGGSIVKSINKFASSIAGEGVTNNSNEAAAAASMMQTFTAQMQMQMQMQMQVFFAQIQMQMDRKNNLMRDQMESIKRMTKAVLKQPLKKEEEKEKEEWTQVHLG